MTIRVVGVDPGRYKVKVWHEQGHFDFLSNLGEYRDLEFQDEKEQDDIIGEYRGRLFTGGTLALRESEFGDSLMTESKLHDDTIILVLIALHKSIDSGSVAIVTGLPVKHHERDKVELKRLLNGPHTIKVNGITKTFFIKCEVVPEGSGVYRYANSGIVRGLNIGSRTVNAITFKDGRKIGRESDTFDFGMETMKSNDYAAMARGIAAKTGALKWKKDDIIYLLGGGAIEIYQHLARYYTNIKLSTNPNFLDAEAFYLTAREIFQ